MSLETLSFSEAFKDVTGGNHKVKTNEYLPQGRFPIVDQGKELIAGYVDNEEMLCKATNPIIIFGDHTKIIKFIDFDFVLGADGVKVLQPCEKLHPKYAYHYLKTVKFPEKTGYMRHFKYLKRASIPVPSLNEQKRIAAILDKAGQIKIASDKLPEIREKLIFSTFNSMFEDVPLTKIDQQHFQIIDGDRGANYPKRDEFSSEGYCLFLNTKNVRYDGFDFTKTEYIPKERHEKLRKGHLQRNDIVLTTRGTVGNVALYDESVDIDVVRINSGMLILRPNIEEINPRYLFHLIQMPVVQRQFDRISSGSAQPQLPITQLRRLEIPIPSLKLQNKFVEIVNNMVQLDCYTLQERTATLPLSLSQDLIS